MNRDGGFNLSKSWKPLLQKEVKMSYKKLWHEQFWYKTVYVTAGGYNVLVDWADTDCRRL